MKILYRADGGHPIGTGHIFRALRIARELAARNGWGVRLLTADNPFTRRVVENEPVQALFFPFQRDPNAVKPFLDARPVLDELARETYDLVLVDMLDTPEADMAAIAATGVPLLTLDDRGPGRLHADTILNVLVAEPEPAGLRPETRLLEGGDYVTLDPLFAEAHRQPVRREFGALRRIFTAMGGADAAGLTVKVARALCLVAGLEQVEFVCGPAFPHRDALQQVVRDAPWPSVLQSTLPTLLDRYRWADLCIVAGGFTMYEVCCVGAPALAVCQPIDHQLELADRLSAAGAMATVGWGLDASEEQIAAAVQRLADDPEMRRQMAERGPQLVDGRGIARVADALIETASRNRSSHPDPPANK